MPEITGRLRTPRLPSAPSAPANGEMYFDTAANVLYWWNGTAWISASGGAPSGAAGGDLGGTYPDPTVARLANKPVVGNDPAGPKLMGGTNGSPDGDFSGPIGSLWLDGAYGAPYINVNGASTWKPIMPMGGNGGEVLIKHSNSDFDFDWGTSGGAPEIFIGINAPTPRDAETLWIDTDSIAPAPVGTPSSIPPLVTSLPALPGDGQECYLRVDAAALYGGPYLWHCRYSSSLAGTSKWEVISGTALRIEGIGGRDWLAAGVTTQSLTYAALSDGLGPSIPAPVAGIYEMECKAAASGVTGTLAGLFMNVTGDGALTWSYGDAVVVPAAAGHGGTIFGRRTRAIATGATVSLYYASSNASNAMKFYDRALYVRPIRIG